MATHSTYLLFSAQMDRFYVGSISLSIKDRLSYHLCNHKGYTAKAKDWVVVFQLSFSTIQEARKLEQKIKKRGARRFLQDIKGE